MWRSVPHTPARSTFRSNSPAPGVGTGTSRISAPGPAVALTIAFMVRVRVPADVRGVAVAAGLVGFMSPSSDRGPTARCAATLPHPRVARPPFPSAHGTTAQCLSLTASRKPAENADSDPESHGKSAGRGQGLPAAPGSANANRTTVPSGSARLRAMPLADLLSAPAYQASRMVLGAAAQVYFRRIEVRDADRVPARGPLLVVANHPASFI